MIPRRKELPAVVAEEAAIPATAAAIHHLPVPPIPAPAESSEKLRHNKRTAERSAVLILKTKLSFLGFVFSFAKKAAEQMNCAGDTLPLMGGAPTQRCLIGACSLLFVLSSGGAYGLPIAKHRRPPMVTAHNTSALKLFLKSISSSHCREGVLMRE